MSRDLDRLREFLEQAEELERTVDFVDVAREALEMAEAHAEPQYVNRINSIRHQIGVLKTDLNNDRPGYVMKQAGAKYQARSGPGNSFTQPADDEDQEYEN